MDLPSGPHAPALWQTVAWMTRPAAFLRRDGESRVVGPGTCGQEGLKRRASAGVARARGRIAAPMGGRPVRAYRLSQVHLPTGRPGGLLGRGLREFAGQEGEGAHGGLAGADDCVYHTEDH